MGSIIGVPRESLSGERMVAATPKTTAQLTALGYTVVVESGAGEEANYSDAEYVAAGATIVDAAAVWSSDIVIHVDPPTPDEISRLKPGAVSVSMFYPASNPDLLTQISERGATALALDAVPRISRAQSLDALSSMSNASGYRGVIEAADAYGAMLAGQVTAAGKTAPAKVFVIGAGVAGLAALGTAGSLGAEVSAFDVRAEVG